MVAIFVIWIICTIIYVSCFLIIPDGASKTYEEARLWFLSISAFGVIFSSLLSSFNSLESSLTTQEKLNFDRVGNSMKYVERWDSPSLMEARDMTRSLKKLKHKLSPEEFCKMICGSDTDEGDDEKQLKLQRSVLTMFNFFEGIYFSIEKDIVDADLLKDSFGTVYCDIFDRFTPYLESIIKPQNQKLYENLKKLRNMWEYDAYTAKK